MTTAGRGERARTRLFAPGALAAGATVALTAGQVRHLRTVLRLGPGAAVAAFNDTDGEWLCHIGDGGGRGGTLVVEHALRPATVEADVWLLFAPIKRARLAWLVEKATELGVATLLPVWTRRTARERLNLDRLREHAIAAAEQSGRLSVPVMRTPQPLATVLAGWPAERRLFVCDESGAGELLGSAVTRCGAGPTAFLVGPEGGFDETELDRLGEFSFVIRVGLGPRVLRAETAAAAVLAVFQAVAGDWRRTRSR